MLSNTVSAHTNSITVSLLLCGISAAPASGRGFHSCGTGLPSLRAATAVGNNSDGVIVVMV